MEREMSCEFDRCDGAAVAREIADLKVTGSNPVHSSAECSFAFLSYTFAHWIFFLLLTTSGSARS